MSHANLPIVHIHCVHFKKLILAHKPFPSFRYNHFHLAVTISMHIIVRFVHVLVPPSSSFLWIILGGCRKVGNHGSSAVEILGRFGL